MAPIDIKFKGQGSNCLDIGNFIACSIFWDPLARQTSSLVDIYMYPWRSRWSQLIFRSWGQRSKVKLLWTLKSILYSSSLEPFTCCLVPCEKAFPVQFCHIDPRLIVCIFLISVIITIAIMYFSPLPLPLLKSHYLMDFWFFFHVTKAIRPNYSFPSGKRWIPRNMIIPK